MIIIRFLRLVVRLVVSGRHSGGDVGGGHNEVVGVLAILSPPCGTFAPDMRRVLIRVTRIVLYFLRGSLFFAGFWEFALASEHDDRNECVRM